MSKTGLFDNLKEAMAIVSEKKFSIQFYDKKGNLTDIKDMNIPEINVYLMSKDVDEIAITITE